MINTHLKPSLTKEDMIDFFKSGEKQTQKIGIEFEKLGINAIDNTAVPYPTIEKLLEKLSEFENYTRVYNNERNEHLIGLKNESGQITLEPGSQFELSINPADNLKTLEQQIKTHNELTKNIAKEFGIIWLGYGLQPVSTYEDIKIIPKARYDFMTKYLPKIALSPLVMMRETAGIQVGIDYENEIDAIEKLKLSLKLAPIVSAVYSNSPIRNGKLSGYKSYRAKSWLNTDNTRCGLVSPKLFEKNSDFAFEDYLEIILKIETIFVKDKNNNFVETENFNFENYIKNGYEGTYPAIEDFERHLSLYFTDTRLKTYLEIRNHDSQKAQYIMSIPAFWKSIMYNKDAFASVNELLKSFSYNDFEELRYYTPKYGTDYKLQKWHIKELAKEIFEISYKTLSKTNEEYYLEPILELVTDGITPADIIIKNFEGLWKRNIQKLIEYSTI